MSKGKRREFREGELVKNLTKSGERVFLPVQKWYNGFGIKSFLK